MKKIGLALLVSMFLLGSTAFAEEFGYVSVNTGEPNAKISIDGQPVSQEYVRRYPLEAGDHYVRVELNGKLMYAEKVTIKPGQSYVVNSENFVDIRTNVASRGAIDRESRRLQEVKGNWGIGVMGGFNFPASGISLKWVPFDWLGVQISGMGGVKVGDENFSSAGAKLIFPIGKRVIWNSVMSGYLTTGYARNVKGDESIDNYGVGVGVEWAPFDPLYFSVEIGGVYQILADNKTRFGTGAALGLHLYF